MWDTLIPIPWSVAAFFPIVLVSYCVRIRVEGVVFYARESEAIIAKNKNGQVSSLLRFPGAGPPGIPGAGPPGLAGRRRFYFNFQNRHE